MAGFDQFNPANGVFFVLLPTWMRGRSVHAAGRVASYIEKR
jgi:hypothetical protein